MIIKILKIVFTPLAAMLLLLCFIAGFIWWDVLVRVYRWTWE